MRKQLISFAQVIRFCKISSSWGGVNPTPPCVRPCLMQHYMIFGQYLVQHYIAALHENPFSQGTLRNI